MNPTYTIVADQHIPFISDIFSDLGKLILIPGQCIGPETVENADILIVRSISKVNRHLLKGSRVTFVGSATAGLDHIDRGYLHEKGITLAHAPGANALSVVEYVLACLAQFELETGSSFVEKTIGIVGAGNVGALLGKRCRALGMNVILCDPPRAEQEGSGSFVELPFLVEKADIISIHTPLTDSGRHPTTNLLNRNLIDRMKPKSWFIHTARGGVCDEGALITAKKLGNIERLALDVWENEPIPNSESIAVADVATGHIAGYSIDAKIRGLHMIRASLMDYLGINGPENISVQMADSSVPTLVPDSLAQSIGQLYPILEDDHRFRTAMQSKPDKAKNFHAYRAEYPVRRTFGIHSTNLTIPPVWKEGLGLP